MLTVTFATFEVEAVTPTIESETDQPGELHHLAHNVVEVHYPAVDPLRSVEGMELVPGVDMVLVERLAVAPGTVP